MSTLFSSSDVERAVPQQRYVIPNEEHVAALWEREAIPGAMFRSNDGRRLQIHSIGRRNPHDGPDYLDARISVNGTLTTGAVEIHVQEHAWKLHGHDADPRYAAVILHVVLMQRGARVTPPAVPLVILSEQWKRTYRTSIQAGFENHSAPGVMLCAGQVGGIPGGIVRAMLALTAGERFDAKRERLALRWRELKESLGADAHPQLFYELLFRASGYGGNQESCEALARMLPYRRLMTHAPESALERFALLCRASGMEDEAASGMQSARRDRFASALHRLPKWEHSATAMEWNARGVRPSNRILPRLEWLAGFIPRLDDRPWWSRVFRLLCHPVASGMHAYDPLLALFRASDGSPGNPPGVDRCREILINVVAPFASVLAHDTARDSIGRAAATLYHALTPAPENSVTRRVAPVLRVRAPLTSLEQQGMIELDARYCSAFRCRDCLIGRACSSSR